MIKNRNIKAPVIAADAIDISKIDLEADPNLTLGVTANRYLQLPTLATGELAAAAAGINGGLVYDTTTNGLKACVNGAYVSLGAGGAANAFSTIACGAGTNPVADASTDTLTLTGTEITVTGDSATDTATFSIAALAITAAKLAATLDISGKTITLPTDQTLTTPTIASFANATHDHGDAAGGGTLSTPALLGTTSSVFTVDSDNVAAAKVAIDTNSATGAFTATIVPPNLSAGATITLPAATSSLATLALAETLASKTLTAPVINGATSSGSTALNFGNNTGTFTTSTGTNTLSGNVAIVANKNFAQSGTGTFGTGTGAVSINGDLTVADGKNYAMTGAGTFGTGTGAVSINGDATVGAGKNLAVTDGTVGLGSGAISTTYATMVTNLNADKVDGKHVTDITAPSYINFVTDGAFTASTSYNGPGQQAQNATEEAYFICPTAGNLTKLYTSVATAPGGSDTLTYTVRKGGSDQTITCVITAAEVAANDTAHTVAVAAGDKISLKLVSSATTVANSSATLEFRGACA